MKISPRLIAEIMAFALSTASSGAGITVVEAAWDGHHCGDSSVRVGIQINHLENPSTTPAMNGVRGPLPTKTSPSSPTHRLVLMLRHHHHNNCVSIITVLFLFLDSNITIMAVLLIYCCLLPLSSVITTKVTTIDAM